MRTLRRSKASARKSGVAYVVLAGCCFTLVGCGFVKTQLALTALDTCLDKQCQGEQGAAREACSRSCHKQYGP